MSNLCRSESTSIPFTRWWRTVGTVGESWASGPWGSWGLVSGGCIRRMGAWIQYFQTLGHSNFIGFQNNVGHTHNWTFYRVQERQWWTGPPAFPETVSRSGDQLWFWDQFEWASIANLVVQRLFGKTIWQLLNCIENSWFEAFVKMGYMGLHGLDFSGFFQPCARVFRMGFPHWDPLVFQPLTINCWIICGQTHHFRNHTSPTKTSDFCLKQPNGVWVWVFFWDIPINMNRSHCVLGIDMGLCEIPMVSRENSHGSSSPFRISISGYPLRTKPSEGFLEWG